MLTARDIMNINTPSLPFDTLINEAIEYMRNNPHRFAAVIASQDRYHGVLTEASMMRIYLRYQNQPDKDALIFYRDCFEPPQLIQEREIFPEVVKKVMTAVGNRVFVINTEGQVIGHISAKDVLPLFSKRGMKENNPNQSAPESLRSGLYLYENFFTKSPFMMHSVNQEGEVQMANEILHTLLGYEYGELIGKTIYELYPKDAHSKAEAGLKTIFHSGYHKVVRGQMVHKNSELIDVELVSRALVDQEQKPVGTITVSRPVDMEYLLKCLPLV
jgi:PAS domain S-box-containing protein